MTLRAVSIAAIALVLLGSSRSAFASEMPVPVSVQFPLLLKIWKLDRTFPVNTEVTLAIIYQRGHGTSVMVKLQVEKWVTANGLRIRTIAVAIDDDERLNSLHGVNADVFYVTPLRGANIRLIAGIARARRIRTTTGVPLYVKAGLSVAIDVRNDRPLIVINVAASRAEGSSFPAQLLQLARLVE